MLIATFRSSYITQYLLLVILAGLLWLSSFINPPELIAESCRVSPLSGFIKTMGQTWQWLPVIGGLIILLLQAFLVNLIMIQHDLVSKNSLIPALVFILVMSSNPAFLTLSGELISTAFILLLLGTAYPLYEQSENLTAYLSLGLYTAMASLFFFPTIFIALSIYMVLWIFRTFNWRAWVIPVIGLIIPYLYLFTFYFWIDGIPAALKCYSDYFSGLFPSGAHYPIQQLTVVGILVLFLLIPAFINILSGMSSYNISTRKKLSVSIWLFFLLLLIGFSSGEVLNSSILWVPAAIIIAHHMDKLKQKWWHELFLFLIFLVLLLNPFLSL
jgi:hypothetical protein